ncbi:MAG: hypothetical protein CVU41_07350 [Chloroflexi bacterium HGW-Chloroflexi-3]|nr:MAG: hypothetical protein CVU41_07350 [Chloroflexi bacterium HGW-Chloroflexi-3]
MIVYKFYREYKFLVDSSRVKRQETGDGRPGSDFRRTMVGVMAYPKGMIRPYPQTTGNGGRGSGEISDG